LKRTAVILLLLRPSPAAGVENFEVNGFHVLIFLTCNDYVAYNKLIEHVGATGYFGCMLCYAKGQLVATTDANGTVTRAPPMHFPVGAAVDDAQPRTVPQLLRDLDDMRRHNIESPNDKWRSVQGMKGLSILHDLCGNDMFDACSFDLLHPFWEGIVPHFIKLLLDRSKDTKAFLSQYWETVKNFKVSLSDWLFVAVAKY
jgi:hypothetical protein